MYIFPYNKFIWVLHVEITKFICWEHDFFTIEILLLFLLMFFTKETVSKNKYVRFEWL